MSAVASEVCGMTERDGRCMNHMDPETKAVHLRLEAWGRWAKDEELHAWPTISLLGRVIEQGISGAGQQGSPPISIPDAVARVDAAVAKLGSVDRDVVVTYYVKGWGPLEYMARKNRMRVREFQNVLRRARWRILGHLGAVE